MFGLLMKKVLSLAITLMLIYVPKERYQKQLDLLPDHEKRLASMDLNGWRFEKVISPYTKETHTYYNLPSFRENARTLVCLHGFNTDGSIFFNLKGLSKEYNIIAYNFPERTSLYRGDISDFNLVLNDFFMTLGIDTIVLAGNSVGGGIALHYTASNPNITITNLILISTSIFGSTDEDVKQIRGMADKLLKYPDYKLFYLLTKGKALLDRMEKTELGEKAPNTSIIIKHVDWYKQALKSLYYYIGISDAQQITCPTVVFHGSNDKLIPPSRGESIIKYIPQAQLEVIDGAGHSLVYNSGREITELVLIHLFGDNVSSVSGNSR